MRFPWSRPTARPSGVRKSWIPAGAIGFALLLSINPALAQSRANLLLDVTVNETAKRLVGNFVRDESGQIGAKASELEEIGIKPPEGVKDPEAIILLNALPGVTYAYDDTKQAITIRAPMETLAAQKFDLAPKQDEETGEPPITPERSWGALANYSFSATGSRDMNSKKMMFNGYSLNLETRAMTPVGTLTHTQMFVGGDLSPRNIKATRLDTTFTYSDPDSRITYRAGDTISGGLAWTRPIRMAGVQAQRNFGLRPDLVTLPMPSLSGSAAVPSSVDVYINNLKTFTQDVSTGPFSINNLPSINGAGTARIVVRDATGREIEQSVPFFVSSKMLKAGLYDFSVEGGFARLDYATENFSYNRKPLGVASARYGVTDWLTLEAHAEGMPGFGMAGIGANVGTFGWGVLSLAGSGSWFRGKGMGGLAHAAYDFQLFGLTFGISSQRTFKAYNDLAGVTAPARTASTLATVAQAAGFGANFDFGSPLPPKANDRVSVGIPITWDNSSFNLSFARVVDGAGKENRIASASYSRRLPLKGSLFATAYVDLSHRKNMGLFAGVSFPITDDISTTATATKSSSGMQYGAQAVRSIRQEEGSYGWRVTDVEGANPTRSATVAYRSGIAQVEAGVGQVGQGVQGRLLVEGAVAAAGGGVFMSPRINDAFAVVDVGHPGVAIQMENRKVATSGSGGKALVPDLRSFQKNRIAIDPDSLPLNASIESTKEMVVPADGGAVHVRFGVTTSVPSAVVKFVNAAGQPLRAGSPGKIEGGDDFVVGYDGSAFVKGLAADNVVRIETETKPCAATFPYQPNGENQVHIGPIACR